MLIDSIGRVRILVNESIRRKNKVKRERKFSGGDDAQPRRFGGVGGLDS